MHFYTLYLQDRTTLKRLLSVTLGIVLVVVVGAVVPSSANNKIQLLKPVRLPTAVGAGETVKVIPAKWTKSAVRTYKWYVGGKLVKSSNTLNFKTLASQKGKYLRVREFAKFRGGVEMSSRSFAVKVGEIQILNEPSLMFSDADMKSATLTLPDFMPGNVKVDISWLKNDLPIQGEDKATYTFRPQDSGSLLRASLRLQRDGYDSREITTEGIEVPTSFEAETQLLWADEFNATVGASPQMSNWVPQNGDGSAYGIPGWGNGESQWYLWEQAQHDGSGNLVIRATRTGASQYDCYYAGNCQWISSKLVTLSKLHVKYGRISIRLKSAQGTGTWPAFWTLGTNIGQVGWPKCGEIDVVELAGKTPFTVWGTPHGPISGGPGNGGSTQLLLAAHQEFHTYTVDWYPDRIVWYVDSKPFYTFRKSENEADWVFDDWQYLILNLAMGGGFGGSIDPNLSDAQLSVDWVRVYKVNGVGAISTP